MVMAADNFDLSQYKTLTVGYNGPKVAALKQRLYELGYYKNNTVNESYTVQTNAYVRKYEEVNWLSVDGVADSEMQVLLFSDLARRADGSPAVKVDLPLEDKELLTEAEIEKQVNQRFADFLAGEGEYNQFKIEQKLMYRDNKRRDLGLFSTAFGYIYTVQAILLHHEDAETNQCLACIHF